MSAGMVTVNAGFRWVRARSRAGFWVAAVVWLTLGGLGHGAAMQMADEKLIGLLYPAAAGALTWPLLVGMGFPRLQGSAIAAVFALLLWWTHWVGWHLADGARDDGPFPRTAWLQAERPLGADPYAFDAGAGAAAAAGFAMMPPSAWPAHLVAQSERLHLLWPPRRPGYDRRRISAQWLRRLWIGEPLLLWFVQLAAVWPRKTEWLLSILPYLDIRRHLRRLFRRQKG
ncbi:MAG: hypothetical protein AAF677_05075 [Pseudomonadota bacterium]